MGLIAAPAPGPDVTPPDPKPAPHGCLLTPSPDPSTLVLAGPGEESVEVTTPVAVNPHPPRTATFSRRVRSLLTLVASSQCSGRIDATRPAGCPALSISELVEMRPAARNLESECLPCPGVNQPLHGCLMWALFWNMRGFRQDSRHRQLIENIRDEHIDIVAVQETLRMYFSLQELEHLSSHMFAWHWLPSSGTIVHSSAILLGVKDATFDIGSMNRGEFYVSMEIFERAITFKWEIVVVYGPTDHSRSTTFLEELHHKISCATLPVVVGGDFNLIRCVQDKSNGWLLCVLCIGSSIAIGSVSATLFWLDCWVGESMFATRFPVLFAIAMESRTSVEVALRDLGRLAFRRPFGPPELAAWDEMLQCIALNSPDVDTTADCMSWCLEPSGRFSARSLYRSIVPSSTLAALTSV
ncbi:ABC transporter G family member 37 [Hordeum vulgare]|nr:ABC transporter G family member 37 [Hordeum vulgare]